MNEHSASVNTLKREFNSLISDAHSESLQRLRVIEIEYKRFVDETISSRCDIEDLK